MGSGPALTQARTLAPGIFPGFCLGQGFYRLSMLEFINALPFTTEFPLWQSPLAQYGMPAVGAVLALTAAVRFCPLYRLLGLNTCRI